MRDRGKVHQQYKQVKFRARKKFLEDSLRRYPQNCAHHGRLSSKDESRVHLCTISRSDPDWDVFHCDSACSRTCPRFSPLVSPDDVRSNFDDLVKRAEETGELGALAYHYPDVAALLWVLAPWEDEEFSSDSSEPPTHTQDDDQSESPDAVEDTVREPLVPWKPLARIPDIRIASNLYVALLVVLLAVVFFSLAWFK